MAISPNPKSRPNSNSRNSEVNLPMRRSFSGNPFQRPSIQPNPRSFVPATPANSPAEFVRTNSFGKEEKENEKDPETLIPAKARSPAVSRGLNRFMAPTISAASKINPSPRKKVLADRNETLRPSLSFFEGKSPSDSANISDFTEDFDQKPEKGFDSKASEIAEDVLATPPNTNRLLKCDSQNSKILPSHSSNLSESLEIKPIIRSGSKLLASSISPSIVPRDADPSLPPYDPKTNYLSPRPQFLHYRPNPRLELYYQKEQGSGTKNLEDSFLSESSTDTEVSEESDSENSRKESENDYSVEGKNEISENDPSVEAINEKTEVSEESDSVNSQKEFENDSSVEGKNEISEKESKNDPSVEAINEKTKKEPENDSSVGAICEKSEKESEDAFSAELVNEVVEPKVTPISTLVSKETSEEKRVFKSRFFTRAKVIPLLLVLLIGCLALSYTHYQIFDLPVYENLSRSKFYEESFNDFARNLKQLSVYSKSYVNELISSFSRGDKFGSLQFSNLTSMLEDPFIEVKRFEEIYEQDEVEPVLEHEDEFESQLDGNQENDIDFESEMIQSIASDLQNGFGFEKKTCPEAPEFSSGEAKSEAINEDDLSTAVSSFENTFVTVSLPDVPSLEQGDHIVSDSEIESTTEVFSSGNTFEMGNLQVYPEYNSETSKDVEIKGDDPIISDSKIEPDTVEPDSGNTLEMDASILDPMPRYKSSKQHEILAISLLAIALIAAPVFIYLKNQKSNTSISSDLVDPTLSNKMKQSDLSPQNYSPEVDLVDEWCPSEMSSFDKSYSYSKGRTWETINEAQSQERKQKRAFKREPLASSLEFSMSDSPSYGSFTTYERLTSKHGYGDDEVVTPVRRSSRIKKIQVTSS